MTLSPERRIRLTSWSVATALHLCAGVLILRAASWGDAPALPAASDHGGVILVTLSHSSASAAAARSLAAPSPPLAPSPSPRLAPSALPAPSPAPAAPFVAPPQPGAAARLAVNTGPAAAVPASELTGAESDRFRQALLVHIARYKQYPPDAERAGVQGTVWVRFLMDRDGRLLDVWVDQSSGARALDDEAVAAIRRAAPFPAIPAGLPDRIDLTLGIPFILG
jgi:protein TonB